MGTWAIDTIDIAGGFLAGFSLKLPSGLTCVIGPRGSGKSTLAEALRYGLAGSAGASKSRQDLIKANLAAAAITIRTLDSDRNNGYTVKRVPAQSPILLANDGRAIESVDLDRGTFLPLDGYSSQEIEDIAKESLGERRRALLDELRAERLNIINLAVSDHRRKLEANADAIRAVRKLIADHTERIEEIGDARARLAACAPPPKTNESARLVNASTRQRDDSRSAMYLQNALDALRQLRGDLRAAIERSHGALTSSCSTNDPDTSALLQHAVTMVTGARLAVDDGMATFASHFDETEVELLNCLEGIQRVRAAHDAEYVRLQADNQAASQAVQEHAQLELVVARLVRLEQERSAGTAELSHLLETRKALKGAYLLERDEISNLREEVAAELQRGAGSKVRIRVIRNADSLGYRQTLLQGLQGARVRNHEDILESLMRLRPEELAQIIQDADVDELERHAELGHDRCERILEAFRQAIDPLTLEIIAIEDRISIELNVSSTSEPNFRDAADLSRGQMCTALLPQLLARRSTPLVIDQPEDNLDNHFIYETIVETVRRLKGTRQMVFITHNANIPVLAEADLVVVLNSDGKKGYIQKAGSLDDCRDEIVDLLEGGEQAFDLRRQRYAR